MSEPVPDRSGMTPGQVAVTLAALAAVAFALVKTSAAAHMTSGMLVAAVAIQPLNVMSSLFAGLRIRALSGGAVALADAFKSVCLANALLFVMPSRLSDLVKPIYLADRTGLPLAKGLAVVAFERIIDVVIVAIGVAMATFLLAGKGIASMLPIWIGLAAAASGAAYVILYRPQAIVSLLRLLPAGGPQDQAVAFFERVSSAVSPSSLPPAFGYAVFAWLMSWSMFHVFLTIAGRAPPTFECSLVTFFAATIGLVAAVAPGGLGTFEAAVVVALGLYGYPVSEALAIAVGLHVAVLGIQLPLAIWVASREGLGLASIARKAADYMKRPRK